MLMNPNTYERAAMPEAPIYTQRQLDAAVADEARSVKEHRERLRTAVRTAIVVLERHGDEHGLCADLRRSLGA